MSITLEEAIEIQKAYIDDGAYEGTDKFMAALKLGIEALERCSYNYFSPQHADFRRLPSETEE